jgi:allophanate hydrolase subunit 2
VSDGIVSGAIQVHGSGHPIVLWWTTDDGGYPKVTVISSDVPGSRRRPVGRSASLLWTPEAQVARRHEEAAVQRLIESMTVQV